MEVVVLPGMAGAEGPSLRSVEECHKNGGLVQLQSGIQLRALTIPHGDLQSAKGMAGFGDPVGNLIVDSGAVGKCVSENFVFSSSELTGVVANDGGELTSSERQTEVHQSVVDALRQIG
nr:unnamed protein product [Spirometra erinaceieuropaei]